MNPFEATCATQSYRETCEDRVAVIEDGARTVVVVVDGAGGSGDGAAAANSVVREIESVYPNVHSANEWGSVLRQIDQRIGSGEAAAVVVDIRTYGVSGASVGDCRAFLVAGEVLNELTIHQKRKPLLGSGRAEPIGFTSPPLSGILVLGTDGFFNYIKQDTLISLVSNPDFCTLSRRCIDSVRLPSGAYWDDIGIVAVRNRPRPSSRKRYAIE